MTTDNDGPESGSKMGRPSKYDESFCKQAYKLCLAGFTDQQLADFFEVTEQTINNWKLDHPDFFESIKKGKDLADAEIANSLFKRAKGFKHKAVKFFSYEGSVITKEYQEYFAPDTTAAIFWLKNRQPQIWRDKKQVEIGGPNGGPIPIDDVTNLTDEQLRERIAALRAGALSADSGEEESA